MSRQQVSWLRDHQRQELALGGSLLEESGDASPTPLKLSNLADAEYVGPIGVGSVYSSGACAGLAEAERSVSDTCEASAQSSVWVVFDTGSTNLWVNSDVCKEGACAKPGRMQYNHSASETYKAPSPALDLKVVFGTGKISGPLATDDFHVGPLTVHSQDFGMMEKQEGDIFDRLPIEGILGLAFPAMAAKGTTPFLENVIQQHAMPKNEVAFYFSNNPSANAMLWGGVDSKFHQEAIEYFNVTKPFYWSIDLLAFEIGGTDLLAISGNDTSADSEPWEAIIDTGTTYWTAPDQIFGSIMAQIQAIPCDSMSNESHPPMTFRFARADGKPRDFTIDNTQYMVSSVGDDDREWCNPAFMKLNVRTGHEKAMIFGEVFLRRYFSVFDRADGKPESARVGFALAAQGEEVDNHLKSITKDQPLFGERHKEETVEEE